MQITKRLEIITRISFLLGFLMFACHSGNEMELGFYHWKSQFDWSAKDETKRDALGLKKISIHYFDWKWTEGKTKVVAKTQFKSPLPKGLETEAVIFIENTIFKHLPFENIAAFADSSLHILEQFPTYTTLQIDCDWTESTRPAFFEFLKHLKTKKESLQISSTLRLHQLKDRELMGIPPVDEVTLMYYNMGDWAAVNKVNSILDNKIGAAYLQYGKAYPLPMKVALPLFGWLVVERHGEVVQLIRQAVEPNYFKQHFYKKITNNKWQVQESHYLAGVYVYKNDILRLELPDEASLLEAADLLKEHLGGQFSTIVFYHWHDAAFQQYSDETIHTIINHID